MSKIVCPDLTIAYVACAKVRYSFIPEVLRGGSNVCNNHTLCKVF